MIFKLPLSLLLQKTAFQLDSLSGWWHCWGHLCSRGADCASPGRVDIIVDSAKGRWYCFSDGVSFPWQYEGASAPFLKGSLVQPNQDFLTSDLPTSQAGVKVDNSLFLGKRYDLTGWKHTLVPLAFRFLISELLNDFCLDFPRSCRPWKRLWCPVIHYFFIS